MEGEGMREETLGPNPYSNPSPLGRPHQAHPHSAGPCLQLPRCCQC